MPRLPQVPAQPRRTVPRWARRLIGPVWLFGLWIVLAAVVLIVAVALVIVIRRRRSRATPFEPVTATAIDDPAS